MKNGFIRSTLTVQQFACQSPDLIIDRISSTHFQNEKGKIWSKATKEARIAAFLSFTRYLSRKTDGIVRRGIPSREGISKTFGGAKRKKVSTQDLSRKQIGDFLRELDAINPRDGLLARVILQGAKRISEVLSLQIEQIDFEAKKIHFTQSKSRYIDDQTIISFEKSDAREWLEIIRKYIGDRKGHVFVTSAGNPISQTQIDRNFALAGKRAGIPFRVSPHCFRATAITLWKKDGFSDSDIMKATGHASAEMVHKYDKTDIADNVTKKISLI